MCSVYVLLYTCVSVGVCMLLYACVHGSCVHIARYVCVCVCVCVRACVHACMRACMHACMRVCMYVHIWIYMYIYTYGADIQTFTVVTEPTRQLNSQ